MKYEKCECALSDFNFVIHFVTKTKVSQRPKLIPLNIFNRVKCAI